MTRDMFNKIVFGAQIILIIVGVYQRSLHTIYALVSLLWYYQAIGKRYVENRTKETIVISYVLAGLFFMVSLMYIIESFM